MIVWFGYVQQEQDVFLVSHVCRPSTSYRAQWVSHSLGGRHRPGRSDAFLVHPGGEIPRAPDSFLAPLPELKGTSVSLSS
jgi:hypothetical protein